MAVNTNVLLLMKADNTIFTVLVTHPGAPGCTLDVVPMMSNNTAVFQSKQQSPAVFI